MQTEPTLSTTESDLIAMSKGLRTTTPLMNLLEELADQGVRMINKTLGVHCRVFKDNSGAFIIATLPKIRPCTKYKQQILVLQGVRGARQNHNTHSNHSTTDHHFVDQVIRQKGVISNEKNDHGW